jgi:hypothetical protein
MAITGTYNLSADPIWRQLPLQEVYLECDTSTAPVTINLFPVSDLQRFWNVKIYVTDISNNAGTNPITINAGFSGVPLVQDTINRQGYTNFNINYNGGDAVLMVVTENKWAVFSQAVLSQTGLVYKGVWDAQNNVPVLTSGVGVSGEYYIVSVAGNTNLDGTTDWQVGDWAIFVTDTPDQWQKVDNHDVQAYNTVQEEGFALPQRSIIDFQGAGVTASDNGSKTIVTVPIQPAYSTIQEEGASLTQQPIIDFQGTGVTATNGVGKTIVTVPIQPAYSTIQEEGASLTQQPIIDFQGTGVTATNGVGKTIVTVNGVTPTNAYGLFAQTTTSVGVSGIAEQSIVGTGVGTLSVPPNAFSIGDSFTSALDGTLSCLSSATLHIHVRTTSGVLLADTGVITMAAATNKPWILTLFFTIRTLGGAGVASISSGGLFSYIRNGGTNFEGYVLSTLNTTTFDTTVINSLDVTAQWNTASTSNVISSTNFTLTKIY